MLKVPGHGLGGEGNVSKSIQYCTPAVMLTTSDWVAVELLTEPTHIPPAAGHAPLNTQIELQF